MKKKKETKSGLGDYIVKDLNSNSLTVANNAIAVVNKYTKMMDGSKLSYEEEREIHKLCTLNSKMMDLICDAFYSYGYDSF